MRQHLISEDKHIMNICYSCGKKLIDQDWKSEFHGEFHYKTTTCWSCGKEHSIMVNFHGSGEDSWEGKLKDIIKFNLDWEEIEKNMSEDEKKIRKNNKKMDDSLYKRIANELGKKGYE